MPRIKYRTCSLCYGPLTRYAKFGLCMRREYRECFPRYRPQRKPRVNDPGIHNGTCVRCISGSPTRSGGKNFPGIPGACTTRNFTHLARGPCWVLITKLHMFSLRFSRLTVISNLMYSDVIQIIQIDGRDLAYLTRYTLSRISFHNTDPLCWESTGHQKIPLTNE